MKNNTNKTNLPKNSLLPYKMAKQNSKKTSRNTAASKTARKMAAPKTADANARKTTAPKTADANARKTTASKTAVANALVKRVSNIATEIDPNMVTHEIKGWTVQDIKDVAIKGDANLELVCEVFNLHMATLLEFLLYQNIRQMHTNVSFEMKPKSDYNTGSVLTIKSRFNRSSLITVSINLDQATIHFGEESSREITENSIHRSFWAMLVQTLKDKGFYEAIYNVHDDLFHQRTNITELYLHKK
jgi:hypothetical protein